MKLYIKIAFCALLTVITTLGYAQQLKIQPKSFVIKGVAKHFPDSVWHFFYPGLFKNQPIEMKVAADGSFSKTVAITAPNDVGLYLHNGVRIFAVPGDTLTLTWDDLDFKNTLNIKANNPARQRELNLMVELYTQYRQPMVDMVANNKTAPDSAKFNRVNNLLTEQFKTILKYPQSPNFEKIVYDQYFEDRSLLHALKLKGTEPKFVLNVATKDSLLCSYIHQIPTIDNTLDEKLFYRSSQYRDDIVAKIRQSSPRFGIRYEGPYRDIVYNYALDDCYAGMAYLSSSPLIRDWYVVRSIIFGYDHYKFEMAEEAYLKVLPEIKTAPFRDSLIAYRTGLIKTLKPGVPAPAFTLTDINGKKVSLADFKGKVVYIDFWGVSCGPCIYDIKTYASLLHQKYNKGIVYLNICVDATAVEWKSKAAELNMAGTNLIAPGWGANPVCKAYNVDGLPHYILVGADGKIANNNAPRMGELLNNGKELDKLLALK